MKKVRKFTIFVLALGFFLEVDPVSFVFHGTTSKTAEAIIGRPATPVSVAGAARRTVRRW